MPVKRILICSTPVGPLGSGVGGGVELTLHSLVLGLSALGHHVEVVAPAGSLHVGARVHQIPGNLQVSSQTEGRDAPISMPPDPVLGAMSDWARAHQGHFDVVLNLAFDWLPLYLTSFFDRPSAISSRWVRSTTRWTARSPRSLLPIPAPPPCTVVPRPRPSRASPTICVCSGVAWRSSDTTCVIEPTSRATLAFIGRISPEKGIDDVFAVAAATGLPVRAWGLMQDRACWDEAARRHPTADVRYEGFLPTDDLQAAIGGSAALLMTPKWVEAFGNVAIEAMACGVPVIAYRRGGPGEIVIDGETGFLVEPDDVAGMIDAVGRVGEIDRRACRERVVERYSTDAFARRVDGWLTDLVAARAKETGVVAEKW